MLNKWQSPQDGNFRAIAMMGMRRDMPVIDIPEIHDQLDKLANSDHLLIDRATRRDYGPKNGKKFSDEDNGVEVELGNRSSRIVGNFQLGTGLATNGQVLLSDIGFGKRAPFDVQRFANLGLIRLKPDIDPKNLWPASKVGFDRETPTRSMPFDSVPQTSGRVGASTLAGRNTDWNYLSARRWSIVHRRIGHRLYGLSQRRS